VQGKNWVVNFWVTPEEEVKVARREAIKRGYLKIARICTIHEGALAVKRKWDEENAADSAITIVRDEEYPLANKDFRPFLNKVRNHGDLDAIFPLLMLGQVGLFARQAREMGIKLPFFGIETFEDPHEVTLSRGALVGHWYINADEPNDLFTKEFMQRFPGSSTWTAANAHDAILLLGEALKSGSSREHINHFLHTVKDFSGALGTYSASGDNRFTLSAAVKLVTKDGFIKIGP